MKIQLLGHYSNINHSIPQGEYELSDERLHGLGKYLVDTGHACVIEDALPVVEASSDEPEIEALAEITFEPLAVGDESIVETEELSVEPEIGIDLAEGEDFTAETVVNVDDEAEPEAPRKRKK